MKKKILFCATIDTHIKAFHLPYLKWFKEKGWEVHVVANGNLELPYVDKKYSISIARSPFKIQNVKAFKELRGIIEVNNYQIIHCHTPMGGVLTRLAASRARKMGTKVIYTAHGFHFYEGAPLKNWGIYYPIEKYLSRYNDYLITLNEEDYLIAKHKFKTKYISLINGVGIDLNKYQPRTYVEKNELRKEFGYNSNDFILIYVGELSFRKHQDILINMISSLKIEIPTIKLLLVGTGPLLEKYKSQAIESGVKDNIDFLGFREDVNKLMSLSDIAISSSRQEGLPVNILEAMATGLPIIVSDCRGNRDLIKDNINGILINTNNLAGFSQAVLRLYNSKEEVTRFKAQNLEFIKSYSIETIIKQYEAIYQVE